MACAGGGGTFAGSEKERVERRLEDWEMARAARRSKTAMEAIDSVQFFVMTSTF